MLVDKNGKSIDLRNVGIRDKKHLCRYLRNNANFFEQDDDEKFQRRLHAMNLTLQAYEKRAEGDKLCG
ncbi:hypothetical protein LCGC14_0548810 [marine sediment metagenome]|uniref:Uncharacterized protein n=1 Tax=marine sediment metagenome TaxID=412755 RepID=A0A0F9UC34_9ZZZZ